MRPLRALLLATALMLVGPSVAAAAPSNDNFANATTLPVPGEVNGSNVGAGKETDEPGPYGARRSVWYRIQAGAARRIVLNTCSSSFDVVVAVYRGNFLEELSETANGDDECGISAGAIVEFDAAASTGYRVQIDGYQGAQGSFTLRSFVRPTAPAITNSNPPSPNAALDPRLSGTAPGGSTVAIFASSDCSGTAAASGDAATFASEGLPVTVAADSVTTFSATASTNGGTSDCSGAFRYSSDVTPPAAPDVLRTDPADSAASRDIAVIGTAAADAVQVQLYDDDACVNAVGAKTSREAFESTGIATTVPAQATKTFYATAFDETGNQSACSATSARYTNTTPLPATPTPTGTDPGGQGYLRAIRVKGTAEEGTTVLVYEDPNCITLAAMGSAAEFADAGIGVYAPQGATATYYARAQNQFGDLSECSTASVSYTNLYPIPVPTFAGTSPASPDGSTTPFIRGTSEAGLLVSLYRDAACTELAVTDTAEAFTDSGIAVYVEPGTTATFWVRAEAADAQSASACSAESISYRAIAPQPDAPTFDRTEPASPNTSTQPRIFGNAPTGTTVRLYTSADCTGDAAVSGSAEDFASLGLGVDVPADSVTTFHATASNVDATSVCSTASIVYTSDGTAPEPPTVTRTDPAGPADAREIRVLGTAEPQSLVKLYRDAECSNAWGGSGTAEEFADTGIAATVQAGTSNRFYAVATDGANNESTCSPTYAGYENTLSRPSAPTLTGTDPQGPGPQTTIRVKGSAPENTSVELFASDTCTGDAIASGSAADLGGAGIEVTVEEDQTTTFTAQSTNELGDVSECSNAISYVNGPPANDDFADAIEISLPSTVATSNVRATSEPGETDFYSTPRSVWYRYTPTASRRAAVTACGTDFDRQFYPVVAVYTGDSVAELAWVEYPIYFNVFDEDCYFGSRSTFTAEAGTTYFIQVYDVNGKTGAIDLTLEPGAPLITDTDPDSPSAETAIKVKGEATPGETVSIYNTANCTGDPIGTGSAATFAEAGIDVTVPANTASQLRAQGTSQAGTTPCSDYFFYTTDVTAPAEPTFTRTDPESPSNERNIRVFGESEANTTVYLYSDAACSQYVSGTSADGFRQYGIDAVVKAGRTATFHAVAYDESSNRSDCSTDSISYTNSSVPPAAPVLTGTDPQSPNPETDIRVKGTAPDDTEVRIFNNASCDGPPLATGSAADLAGDGIEVFVAPGQNELAAESVDGAGDESACSNVLSLPGRPAQRRLRRRDRAAGLGEH